jgi:CxxC motif-containing protein
LIPAFLEKISAMSVSLPVRQGDVLGSLEGVNIVATRSVAD